MFSLMKKLSASVLVASLLLTGCAVIPPEPPVYLPPSQSPGETPSSPGASDTSVQTLTGVLWQLVELRDEDGAVHTPDHPSMYTLTLAPDGMAFGRADCNQFRGDYTMDGAQISFGPMLSTMAMCPEGSLYDLYMQALGSANAFALEDNGLSIAFGEKGGTLLFAPASENSESSGLTPEQVANATIQGIYDELVTLTDGRYEGAPFVAGGASRPTVTLVPDSVAFGDLDGDGVADGVAVLVENSGGSGSFFYLAGLLNRDGQPENVATTLLGDRVRVESIGIHDGLVELVAATFADDDPMCCPSQRTRFVYELVGGDWVELSAETL